jgi:hypothetical protein
MPESHCTSFTWVSTHYPSMAHDHPAGKCLCTRLHLLFVPNFHLLRPQNIKHKREGTPCFLHLFNETMMANKTTQYTYTITYVCMHVWMDACMNVCMYSCMHACMHVCMDGWMHVCMYACLYVCLLCMCMCMYMYMDMDMYMYLFHYHTA